MKKIFSVILISFCLFAACKKEIMNVSTLAPVGYPTIILSGDSVISLPVGTGPYTDAGANGLDNITGNKTSITPLSNDVDLTKPGFYTVQFEFRNKDGFRVNRTRYVLVTPVGASVDISGTYARTSNGVLVYVTKIATGLYIISNVGGVAAANAADSAAVLPVYMGQLSDTTIQVPAQNTGLGTLYCDYGSPSMPYGKLSIAAKDTFSYVVENGSFGTSVRTFIQQ